MSFLKITDPEKRDFIIEEFLKTKHNVKTISCLSVWENLAHNTNFQIIQANYIHAKGAKRKHRQRNETN